MFVIALHLTNALFGGKVTTNPAFVQILNQIHHSNCSKHIYATSLNSELDKN